MPQYDYIVVGAGSAGAVVTRRLVDAGASVLLLEAGGRDTNPDIHEPSGLFNLWLTAEDWGYFTIAQEYCHNRQMHWPRGKVLGGSSSLNGMIYVRGNPHDYDTWAYLGNYGWSYADVLPYFKRSEDFDGGESHYHGVGGPLRVTSRFEPHPATAAFSRRRRKPVCRSTPTATPPRRTAWAMRMSRSKTGGGTAQRRPFCARSKHGRT